MQSIKDKISSKDISEISLFSLIDTSVMSQIVEIILIATDWNSLIMVSNVSCILFLRISSISFIVYVEMAL